MASATACVAKLNRNAISSALRPNSHPKAILLSSQHTRQASSDQASKYKRKNQASQKKKKSRSTFVTYNLKDAEQFSLCDAMRYIRAFEVGYPPTSPKYEMHIKLRTLKNGPAVRNRLQLPHPVKTDLRICVICPPDSSAADDASQAGAYLIGEEDVFAAVKEGNIDFDRCICHVDSLQKLNKAGLGKILGPRGLLPSMKTGTVVKNVAHTVRSLVGASEYRERMGVIRMAVGQLGFSSEEMQKNIRAFVEEVKKDINLLSDKITKDIHEVVLSSTHSPGFSLSGEFKAPESVLTKNFAS
ncbi:mitochondrial large ribosomal subunit protein L1 [Patellaria atrata CBS 101060]|uniref:Mitochondrial large ribosomal subunit protein L1 n=1 Tax=Patellaria atrata CBS 101060 TaxID=1346257 RepID=A0A9P4VTP9_9PEZI|nr:mitochondrial large ribosomal subunit protein L1 [Patellaria atrata CBS 101060]